VQDKFHFLWGLPILITKINSNSYDKKNILEDIEKNYNNSNIRNKWSNSFYQTNIHHSHSDKNSSFKEINYSSLKNCYDHCIQKYFNHCGFTKKFNYSYEFVNYTCTDRDSLMEPHIHSSCEFSMVHYCQFDKKEHLPTIFISPYIFSDYWNSKKMINLLDKSNTNESWLFSEWKHDIEEDDVIIYPSILKHFLRNIKSNKKRITIATNIYISEEHLY